LESAKKLPIKRTAQFERFWIGFFIGVFGSAPVAIAGLPWWASFLSALLVYYAFWYWQYSLLLQANIALRKETFDTAIDLALQSIAKHPKQVESYVTASAAYIFSGKANLALPILNEALTLRPEHALALNNRAAAYVAIFDAESAIKDATQCIALAPKLANPHLVRANAYLLLSKYELALDDCNTAINLSPTMSEAYVQRALAYIGMNRLTEAMKDCNGVIASAVHKPSARELAHALVCKAIVHSRLLQFDAAIQDSTHSLDLQPVRNTAILLRAYSYGCTGEFAKAMKDLHTFEAREETDLITALTYATKAQIYLMQNELELASQSNQFALKIEPKHHQILTVQGQILAFSGNLDEAKKVLDSAIEIDPFNAEAFWFRHQVLLKLGQAEDAAKDKAVAEGFGYKPLPAPAWS